MLRRIPCAEIVDGGILVEDMNLGMRVHFMLKAHSTKDLYFEYQSFITCRLEPWLWKVCSLVFTIDSNGNQVSQHESIKTYIETSQTTPATLPLLSQWHKKLMYNSYSRLHAGEVQSYFDVMAWYRCTVVCLALLSRNYENLVNFEVTNTTCLLYYQKFKTCMQSFSQRNKLMLVSLAQK